MTSSDMKRRTVCLAVMAVFALSASANAQLVINVNMYASNGGNQNPQDANILDGPGGGLGEVWNQFNTKTGSDLLDAAGATTSVGFSNNVGTGWAWSNPDLKLVLAGRAQFGKGADFTHTVNGLTPGSLYDVWIASYAHNTTAYERAAGEWSTTNPTTTVGVQIIDCRDPNNRIGDQWVYGVNYVQFENVEADPNGEIAFLSDAWDFDPLVVDGNEWRLPLNGWRIEEVSTALVGDTNGDGIVDATDYIALKTHLGQGSGATLADGDLDEDGDVDWADLDAMVTAINAAGGAVPEPATMCLLTFGALAIIRRRRK